MSLLPRKSVRFRSCTMPFTPRTGKKLKRTLASFAKARWQHAPSSWHDRQLSTVSREPSSWDGSPFATKTEQLRSEKLSSCQSETGIAEAETPTRLVKGDVVAGLRGTKHSKEECLAQ